MAKNSLATLKKTQQADYTGPLGTTFLKAWRKKKGISQVELGDDVGVSNSTVSEIENGNTGYHQAYLEAVSRRLDVHVCDLLCRDPNEPEGIWTLWEAASPKQRRHIIGMVRGFLESNGG